MSPLRLYAHALRVARPRQLWARVARPVRRRRFPRAAAGPLRAIDGAAALWRSPAFAHPQLDERGAATRLHGFHQHYGEDVLAAARAGNGADATRLLAAWILENPPSPGDPWHPYVASTRIGSWVAALTLEPSLATAQVAESLARQVAYVGANVEDDVLGNHVIRNARALVLGGRALGDAGALERGLALLRRELPEQVLSDGGHYERSPVYHLVVLRDLLEVRAASEAGWLDEPIARMQRFAAGLQRPDGAPALFNDGTLDLAPQLDLAEPAPGLSVFEETGYAVLREPGLWLAFDCGPPSPAFLPAHAHADALSFQLWLDGRPVVVDPGTSTYEPGTQRDLERSTAVHATIALDGRSQFELWGAFRSGPLPQVRLLGTEPLAAEVIWPSGARHRRTIAWDEREIRIDDELDLPARTEVLSSLPLAADAVVDVEPVGELRVETEARSVSERLFDLQPGTALTARGEAEGRFAAGWRIPRPR